MKWSFNNVLASMGVDVEPEANHSSDTNSGYWKNVDIEDMQDLRQPIPSVTVPAAPVPVVAEPTIEFEYSKYWPFTNTPYPTAPVVVPVVSAPVVSAPVVSVPVVSVPAPVRKVKSKRQPRLKFAVPSKEQAASLMDRANPKSSFHDFIGNDRAVDRISRIARLAVLRKDHACGDLNVALIGSAGLGKTTLAKMYGNAVDLPFVEIDPNKTKSVHSVFEDIESVLSKKREAADGTMLDISLVNLGTEDNPRYELPPCIIFIDEVHLLPNRVEEGLLKAVEANDRSMVTEKGVYVDTKRACFIVGTTDFDKLKSTFRTRFTQIELDLYTKSEIADIIKIKYPDWDMNVCNLVAKYSENPREADAFAREMNVTAKISVAGSLEEIAAEVAELRNIDEHGMSYQRLSILKALAFGPIASSRLHYSVRPRCSERELDGFVLPPLRDPTAGNMPLIAVTSRGYCVTPAGLAELDRRNIANAGLDAIPASEVEAMELAYIASQH